MIETVQKYILDTRVLMFVNIHVYFHVYNIHVIVKNHNADVNSTGFIYQSSGV